MPDSGSVKATGRNLPSWMSSRDTDKKSESKEPSEDDKGKRQGKPQASQATTSSESSLGSSKSSKLLVRDDLQCSNSLFSSAKFLDNNFDSCRKGLYLCSQDLLTLNAAH